MSGNGKRNAPVIIKVLVALHIVAIFSWSMPVAPAGVRNGRIPAEGLNALLIGNEKYGKQNPFVRTYLLASGFWQYWDMFAPDPASQDRWGDAEVIRQDGSVEIFQYPRMFLLPIHKKLVMERYRKFYERANLDDFAYTWPRFALVIAKKCDNDPKNRPIKVRLTRHWQFLPKVGGKMPTEYQKYTYWEEIIDLKLLDQAEGK